MAVTGTAAALASAYGIYQGKKLKKSDEAAEQAHQTQVETARAIATAEDPLKRAAEAAQRARSSRLQASRALAAGAGGRSSLLTTPLGGYAERKTLLGT